MNITKGEGVQWLRRRLKRPECTFKRLCGCYRQQRQADRDQKPPSKPELEEMNTTSTSRSPKDVQRHARRKPVAGIGV